MTPRARAAFWAGTLALALSGCSSSSRCEPVERCDVRTPGCQRAALQYAVCLRGRDESAELGVSVVTLDRSEYLDEAEQLGEQESEAKQQMRMGLSLFGFAAPPSSRGEARVANARLIGGFYDSEERRITLIDDGEGWSSGGNVLLLVHELLHALQDAAGELDLEAPPHSLDQTLARRALIEGEATLLGDEAAAEGFGFSFSELDYGRALASYRSHSLEALARSDSLFDEVSMRFQYAFGASYLWPLRREAGAAALGEVSRDPPVSTYAVMNADPAYPGLREDDLEGLAAPVLPELTRVGCYRLGRFLYEARVRAGQLGLPFDDAFVADTLCVFAGEDNAVSAVWRVRFDSEAAAEWAAMENPVLQPALSRTGVDGTDVWWTANLMGPPAATLTWEAAPAQDFGFEDAEPASRRVDCPRRVFERSR